MHHIQEVTIDGQLWYRLTGVLDGPITFGFHGDYLVAATDDKTIQDIVRRMQNAPPVWWAKIRGQLPVERRSVVAYVNLRLAEGLLSSASPAGRLKSTRVGHARPLERHALIEVWGLEGEDFANKTLLLLDGKPRGLLRLVSDHPLRPEDLSRDPRARPPSPPPPASTPSKRSRSCFPPWSTRSLGSGKNEPCHPSV